MNLKNLNIKRSYDPSVDGSNVVNDFYIPCLSSSIRYDRCSAYFSSAILKQISRGLFSFYKNKGHARFIFSCKISDEEMANITQAYKEKMENLALSLDDSLNNDFEIANFAYLIKHNLAEVKIAFMVKDKSSLMHIKAGLFEDSDGNKVYFDGSGNETEAGILKNAEVFNVFNNFNEPNFYVDNGDERFNKLWNNTYSPNTVYTVFPVGKLFDKLISYSKDKMFKNLDEYLANEDYVYIDIDSNKGKIIVNDYTKEKILQLPGGLNSIYKNVKFDGSSKWTIDKLSLHDIRDIIPQKILKYGKKIIYSPNANSYISSQDLKLNQRVKLAESVKTLQNIDLWEKDFNIFKSTIQHEVKRELKDKQYENAYHHYALKSAMDFSVPGTGKTYISYGLFAYLYSKWNKVQDVNHVVIFGPLNCFKAWKEESKNIFGNNRFTVFDITEHRNDFEKDLKNKKYHIYLFNYESITKDKIGVISNDVLDDKTLVVFDEIHKLKSITGIRANNIIEMLNNCPSTPIYKLALTGTPLPNSYVDLYNYLRILYADDLNGFLGIFSENKLKNANENQTMAKEIQDNLHPLFTRTTKKDLNIPLANPDDLDTLSVNPSENEIKLFELIHKAYKNPLLKFIRLIQASSNPSLILKKINLNDFQYLYDDNDYLLKQLQSNAIDDESLFKQQKIELINRIGISSKTKQTINFIKNNASKNRKMIVWCLFLDTIELLKSELKNAGFKCASITGCDDIKIRDQKLEEFKNGDTEILITNPNTLAESVSLHQICHDALYLEFGFNLTYLLQSKDRIHRVGLKEGTQTNYFFALAKPKGLFDSIDMKIYERLQQKATRMISTIESDNLIPFNDTADIDDINNILGNK